MRKTGLLQEVESPSEIQKGNCRKKWLVVILLHGGVCEGLLFLLILLMVLDQMSWGKAPQHCKGSRASLSVIFPEVQNRKETESGQLQEGWTLRARPAPRKAVGGC